MIINVLIFLISFFYSFFSQKNAYSQYGYLLHYHLLPTSISREEKLRKIGHVLHDIGAVT